MNTSNRTIPTPQLGFDFFLDVPGKATINKTGAQDVFELDLDNPSGISAGDALSRMCVDDRVLGQGMTTWRALLDHALACGYTELYPADEGRPGLRKPGMRFGPIARMPDLGPEYVKRSLVAKAMRKVGGSDGETKSARFSAGAGMKAECLVAEGSIQVNFFEGRKHAGCVAMSPADLPFTNGTRKDDAEAISSYLVEQIRTQLVSGVDAATLAAGALKAIGSILKVLED